jgi:predicted NAD/FAD-binding protein
LARGLKEVLSRLNKNGCTLPIMKIAIVGSGISGLASAWYLSKQGHSITVFEKGARPGGHAETLRVELTKNGQPVTVPVNTAYDLFNQASYPHYLDLLSELGLTYEPREFSYTFRCVNLPQGESDWEMFLPTFMSLRNASQLLRSDYRRFAKQASRLGKRAVMFLADSDPLLTFGGFLRQNQVSEREIAAFYLPVFARPWGITPQDMERFPAEIILSWMVQNKTLTPVPVKWVSNRLGAQSYIDSLAAQLAGRGVEIRLETGVPEVSRNALGVVLDGERFDQIVISTHAPQALKPLNSPTEEEREILSAFKYQTNQILVHSDESLMPPDPSQWSYFNIRYDAQVKDSYNTVWFGKDQGLPVFLTNYRALEKLPPPDRIFGRFEYHQPIFNPATQLARKRLQKLQGQNRTWYAGVYTVGTGHHESGVVSAKSVTEGIGRLGG